MTRRQYAGGAAAALITSAISSSGGGTVTIDNIAGWPDGSIGKFHVTVDAGTSAEEKILVDLRAGNSLNFSSAGRGADGTVSTSHATGASIWICYTALDADEANAHINATAGSHTAAAITFAPTAGITATTVQGALAELDATDTADDVRIDTLEAQLGVIQSDNWVTQARIADGAVGAAELAIDSVTNAKLASDSVGTAELIDASVSHAKLAANAVSRWSFVGSSSISSGTAVTVAWASEQEDDLNIALIGTPFTVITMPAGSDGWWGVDLSFTVDASLSTGFIQLTKNVTYCYRHPNLIDGAGNMGCTWNLYLVAGDTIDFRIHNANVLATVAASALSLKMCRIGKTV